MDVYPLPQGHRVQDFFHDVDRQIGQQPHYALGIQMQAVIRLINTFCIGNITQDVLAIVDVLRRKAAGEMQPVIAALCILMDGHIQAEHIMEGAGGVQVNDVIAIAAGNDILAAVLHLILFQPVLGDELGELLVKIAAVDHGKAAGDSHGISSAAQVHSQVRAAHIDVKIVKGHEFAGTRIYTTPGVDIGGVDQAYQQVVGAVAGVHVHHSHRAVFNVPNQLFHPLLDSQRKLVGSVLDDIAGG